MTKRLKLASRLILLAGTLVALAGLAGFWLWPAPDTVSLNTVEQKLLGLAPEDRHLSVLVAGRDILYDYSSSRPVYSQSGQIICWVPDGYRSVAGANTDTIIYASLRNDVLSMVSLPRDLFIGEGTRKINSLIQISPDALVSAAEDILGVPIDHYAILNLEIFQNAVDALGGVEVDVPQRMRHYDCTGGVDIDLQPGIQRLDGKLASDFVRFRSMPRSDLDRLENMQQLALAMLRRVRELNVTAVTRLPALVSTVMADVETDLAPADVMALLPRLADLQIGSIGTIPTEMVFRGNTDGLDYDPAAVENYLASAFGGTARTFQTAPESAIVITNRTGDADVADWYLSRLVSHGVPAGNIVVRDEDPDPIQSRLVATLSGWEDAGYYASLLNLGMQQVNRLGTIEGATRHIELVLGEDAMERLAQLSSPFPDPTPVRQTATTVAPLPPGTN